MRSPMGRRETNSGWTRRDFLQTASAATLSALAAGAPRALNASDLELDRSAATADNVIVLWMGGGMASNETFDPKRHTSFVAGMKSADGCSALPAVATKVDGLQCSQHLERIGAVMDRGTVIRTAIAADLGSILHSRHQYHW